VFYDQLQKLCREKGEKLTPLCQKLGLSTSGVGSWQNGTVPNGETLIKFAKYFGVSTDYLLGLSELSEQNQQENKFELIESEENDMDIQEIKQMFEKQNQEIQELKAMLQVLLTAQSQSSPDFNPASGENKK
jgi:transcriptional regulator with XRE-family HTH domain